MTFIALSEGIRLFSGAMFDYNNPADSDVVIEDIAHALSNNCRFAGHCKHLYSIAQHAVNASMIVPPEYAFDALMHDTAEFATNDIPTPLKIALPVFKELEVRIESSMSERFGFTYPLSPAVKLADAQMLALEKETLLPQDTSEWEMLRGVDYAHLRELVDLTSWTPERARFEFLDRYEEIKND
jgi:hypothetical protein